MARGEGGSNCGGFIGKPLARCEGSMGSFQGVVLI